MMFDQTRLIIYLVSFVLAGIAGLMCHLWSSLSAKPPTPIIALQALVASTLSALAGLFSTLWLVSYPEVFPLERLLAISILVGLGGIGTVNMLIQGSQAAGEAYIRSKIPGTDKGDSAK